MQPDVVDQDAGARLNVIRQAFVGDGNDGVVTLDIAGGQRELLTLNDLDLAVLIGLGTDLRTLVSSMMPTGMPSSLRAALTASMRALCSHESRG